MAFFFLPAGALRPLAYFFVALLFQELVLRRATLGKLGGVGLALLPVFSASAAFVLAGLCWLLPAGAGWVAACLLLGLLLFFYGSQLVYNKVFRTYYTFFSAANGGKAFQFWTVILTTVGANSIPLLLLALPLVLALWRGRQWLLFPQCPPAALAAAGAVLCHVLALGLLRIAGRGACSPYSVYYEMAALGCSVDRLGMLTAMRLDIQRYLRGFTPRLEMPPPPADPGPEDPGAPQVLPLDLAHLADIEPDKLVAELHRYFAATPPTRTNDMTGRCAGDNLILLVGETFSSLVIDEKRTPTLWKMAREGFSFPNFYVPLWGCSTTDGEYATLEGLIPKEGVWSLYLSRKNHLPFTLGNQLRARGYTTNAYHDHQFDYYMRHLSHPNLGYEYQGLGGGLELTRQWPESDLELMEATLPRYLGKAPFHTYYLTVSGHMGYNFYDNAMAKKHRALVEDLPCSQEAKAYLACNVELDRAMAKLLDALDQAGLGESTLISLSPDHYPYGLSQGALDQLWGHPVERNFELYKTSWILYKKGMAPVTVDRPCSNLDILPTLSNLLGLAYDSRMVMGTDVFSSSPPLVMFYNRSWITDSARYNAATGKVESLGDAPVDKAYVDRINALVNSKFVASARILETDYYGKQQQSGTQG